MVHEKLESEDQNAPEMGHGYDVLLADMKPLLTMQDIDPAAETFHHYAAMIGEAGFEKLTMPITDYFRILWELSVSLQDETIHLSSRHLMPGSTSFIMSSIAGCDNLEQAMRLIAKSYNMLHGGSYNRVEIRDGMLFYIIDDSEFPYQIDNRDYVHFTLECVLIYLHGILSYVTSRDLLPMLRKVYTKQERGATTSRHMSYWTVPIRYQSGHYTLMYSLKAAELPIKISPDHMPTTREIYDHVISLISRNMENDQSGDLNIQVRQLIDQGMLSQEQVAQALGYSVATLRRHLKQQNLTFRQITQEILNDKAKRMLSQGIHVSDISDELGFSEYRSFIRAFKGWNGVTPNAYCKSLN